MGTVITSAVEGLVDEAVVLRVLVAVGGQPGFVYGKKGKQHLIARLNGYNEAAKRFPWLVLLDLDRDADCAPPMQAQWLPAPASQMCFRIAVRSIEAWLLADRSRIAQFLGIRQSLVTRLPDSLDDPKKEVVDLARRSPRSDIRHDLVPRRGSGRSVGPAYSSRLVTYIRETWRPDEARDNSASLDRCLVRLEALVGS